MSFLKVVNLGNGGPQVPGRRGMKEGSGFARPILGSHESKWRSLGWGILLALWAAHPGQSARAQSTWAFADAPFRCTFEAGPVPQFPDAGWLISLPDMGFGMEGAADTVLVDSAGKPVPIQRVFRGELQDILLIAKDLQPKQRYFLYFGGNRPRNAPTWNPRQSLYMEMRAIPMTAQMRSAQDMESLWKGARVVFGGAFIDNILGLENPFSETAGFIARYRGMLNPKPGKYEILAASVDAGYVWLNQKLEFPIPNAPAVPSKVSEWKGKEFNVTAQGLSVDYLHAWRSGDDTNPVARLMRLDRSGPRVAPKMFDTKDWTHPGTTQFVKFENDKMGEIPILKIENRDYVGWGDELYFDSRFGFKSPPPDDLKVVWEFKDGSRYELAAAERILVDASPVVGSVTLTRGAQTLKLAFRTMLGSDIKPASINKRKDVQRYISKMFNENLMGLPEYTRQLFFKFAREFGTEDEAARMAEAWIAAKADPANPLFEAALLSHLHVSAQRNPQAALGEMAKLDPKIAQKFLKDLALFELDTRVFLLRDDSALALATKMANTFSKDADMLQTVRTRLGDLFRLQGKVKEAEEAYLATQKNVKDESEGRKYAAQDRANSVEVTNLLENGYRVEAMQKLRAWEREHPMAKLQSDFLLLSGRVLMEKGRWMEALQEIDSYKLLNPDSPLQIPADFYRALALRGLGRRPEAVQIWSSIATQYPRHPLAAESLRLTQNP
jgi:tetratricopeptide (TPR) repeat protein